jgi:hypothetical protein
VYDVLLDSTAALGAQILLFIFLRGWRKESREASKVGDGRRAEEKMAEQQARVGN